MRLVECILVRSTNSPAADERFQRNERCVVKEEREECFREVIDRLARTTPLSSSRSTFIRPIGVTSPRLTSPHLISPHLIAPHRVASYCVAPRRINLWFAHAVWNACIMSDRSDVSEKKFKWSNTINRSFRYFFFFFLLFFYNWISGVCFRVY